MHIVPPPSRPPTYQEIKATLQPQVNKIITHRKQTGVPLLLFTQPDRQNMCCLSVHFHSLTLARTDSTEHSLDS